nr:hypothetical protein [Sulfurimonas sp.]
MEFRPAIVEDKSRVGDWEADTIIGKNHHQAIVTLVDRNSKFTLMKKVVAKQASKSCNRCNHPFIEAYSSSYTYDYK